MLLIKGNYINLFRCNLYEYMYFIEVLIFSYLNVMKLRFRD